MMGTLLVVTTADSESLACRIASALVEAGVAACVNILPGVRSIYKWEGKVCDEWEFLLMIKTTADRWESVRSLIRELHSYQIPEVIALAITEGDPDYLSWLGEQVKSPKGD